MQGLISSRPGPNSQPSAMILGSDPAAVLSGGRRFDGTWIVRAPAIRYARNDGNSRGAVSLDGAPAFEMSGPTSDPDRTTIAIAPAASTPPALRPSAGRRTTIWIRLIGRSSSTNDITAINRETAATASASIADRECPSTAGASTSAGQCHRYQEYDQAPTR